MNIFRALNRNLFFLTIGVSLVLTNAGFAEEPQQQQVGAAPLPNCVPDPDSTLPATLAVQNATAAAGAAVSAIAPAFILGGAGGYGATPASRGDHSVLFVAGVTKAGTSKGYFAPAGIYYYAPKDKLEFGVGQNGVAGSSSPDNGTVNAAGDIALNAVYTIHETKDGKLAVAAMVNSNINVGHKAYDNGLTSHSGVNPVGLVTYTPKDNNSFTAGVGRIFSFGGSTDSGTANTDGNFEYDHQFSQGHFKNVEGSVGVQTATGNGAKTVTPFTVADYTHGSTQYSVGFTRDVVVTPGNAKSNGLSFGLVYTFKNKDSAN